MRNNEHKLNICKLLNQYKPIFASVIVFISCNITIMMHIFYFTLPNCCLANAKLLPFVPPFPPPPSPPPRSLINHAAHVYPSIQVYFFLVFEYTGIFFIIDNHFRRKRIHGEFSRNIQDIYFFQVKSVKSSVYSLFYDHGRYIYI